MNAIASRVQLLLFFMVVWGGSMSASQAAPCFVSPKSGAVYQAGNTVYDTKRSLDDCAVLSVQKGEVTVLYLDGNGRSQSANIKQGTRFTAVNAANSRAPHAPLKLLVAALTQGPASVERGGKFFDKPDELGLPSGDVHVPAGGLPLAVRGAAGLPFSYVLEEAKSSLVLLKGTGAGGQPMTLPRRVFKPETDYRLSITFADRTASSVFTTPTREEESELIEAMARIENDTNLDAFSKPIARALVFEDRSFGYNRELSLKALMP